MAYRILSAALVACLAGLPLSAYADSSGKSHCYWTQGIFVCESSYETPYSKTYTLCGAGRDAACTTRTTRKEPPKPYVPPPEPTLERDAATGVLVGRGMPR